MITNKQILSAITKWKKENRFKTVDVQEKLGLPKHTYHRRIKEGNWTHSDIEQMKKLGILPKK